MLSNVKRSLERVFNTRLVLKKTVSVERFFAFDYKYFKAERMFTMLLAELFKKDIVEDCRKEFSVSKSWSNSRIAAELILKDGTRRIYRCKSVEQQLAVREVIAFVKGLEENTGDTVIWRFKGSNQYHMGSDLPIQYSKAKQLKNKLVDFFFGLE